MRVLSTGMEWFSENPGGLPRYFADYLNAWREHGGEIQGCVRTGQQNSPDKRPGYVKSIYSTSTNPFRVRREWEQTLGLELEMRQYDVFNPHFAYYAWGWTRMKTDIPVVTHFHGPWAYEGLIEKTHQSGLKKTLEFRMQRYIEQSVYRRSDRFIVLSQFFRDQLVRRYDVPTDRIHIIPGAVDVGRFRDSIVRDHVRENLGIPSERFVLVTVRRLVRRMGIDNLIRAVHQLRASFPEVFLVVVGGGPLYDELSDIVRELNLSSHVLLTNRVPDDVLPSYYQAADLTVVPTIAWEGFGFVTVESMACGTPVAGTPIGGTKEILEKFDASLLFDGASEEDLVYGLNRLLRHRTEIPSRKATRNHVLNSYTWDAVIPQIVQVFEMAGAGRWS